MRARVALLLISLGLVMAVTAAPVAAASLTVNSVADTVVDDGSCTLREAINSANSDTASGALPGECAAGSGADQIGFSVSGTITLTAGLFIDTDLSIVGAGAITVSGASTYTVFAVDISGDLTVSGLTITAGSAGVGGNGGGIHNDGGILTVTDSTITGNAAGDSGGGIFNDGGAVTVTNSTISANTAPGAGGGIHNFNGGTVTVTNSTISGNSASGFAILGGFGGGIFSSAGSVSVTNSTISANSAVVGGGIFVGAGNMTVTNSTISGNSATSGGGGMFNGDGTLSVSNSTISGNTASVAGGGIFNQLGVLTVSNSTLSGNTSGVDGGGVYSQEGVLTVMNSTISGNVAASQGGGLLAFGNESLVNTIMAGNTATFGTDILQAVETQTTSIVGVPVGKTLADILVPAGLANNGGPTQTIALALVAGNPAIDTGTSAVCAAAPVNGLDQRGLPRPAACDIGAYEVQPVTPLPNAAMGQPESAYPWIALGFAALLVASLASLAVANLGVVRRRR